MGDRITSNLPGKVSRTRYNQSHMSTPIQIIPKIQSLELEAVGCWESLHMDFIPGVNIITGEPGSLGKTTILASIMSEVSPDNAMGLVAPRLITGQSRIAVQLMPSEGAPRVVSSGEIPPKTDDESHGQYVMRILKSSLATAEPDDAIIFDDEVLGRLDMPNCSKAVKWLNSTTAQVICVAPRWIDLDVLPEARVFACSWDKERDQAEMRVRQQGQQTGP